MLTIYHAVFQRKPSDIEEARKAFILEFGPEAYDRHIAPYLDEEQPGFLFCGPSIEHTYFFMHELAVALASRTKQEYEPPAQFMAVPDDPAESVECSKCHTRVIKLSGMSGQRFGFALPICMVCYAQLSKDAHIPLVDVSADLDS